MEDFWWRRCLCLRTRLGIINWARFLVWLAVGLAICFLYRRKSSKLNRGMPNESSGGLKRSLVLLGLHEIGSPLPQPIHRGVFAGEFQSIEVNHDLVVGCVRKPG